eukprot:1159557-Pelagomonas_calceolata.AAC.26
MKRLRKPGPAAYMKERFHNWQATEDLTSLKQKVSVTKPNQCLVYKCQLEKETSPNAEIISVNFYKGYKRGGLQPETLADGLLSKTWKLAKKGIKSASGS